jgi:hypothetical protein
MLKIHISYCIHGGRVLQQYDLLDVLSHITPYFATIKYSFHTLERFVFTSDFTTVVTLYFHPLDKCILYMIYLYQIIYDIREASG